MSFNIDFEMKVRVEFSDEPKSKAFFIDGDWKESFYDLVDLEDLASSIASGFVHETPTFQPEHRTFGFFLEGYGLFLRTSYTPETYVLTGQFADDCGGIAIKLIDELEAAYAEGTA
ncbi:hypothetical protein [Halomonas sp. RT37]|uniref:DUF3630 family protein n=1 Tax=Halomonas sp. RT37 TaxID=2950872 RepID=A0AAU7KBY9_9GAMM